MGIFPDGVFPGTSSQNSPFGSQPASPFGGLQGVGGIGVGSNPGSVVFMGSNGMNVFPSSTWPADTEEETPPVISPALRSQIDGLVFRHGVGTPAHPNVTASPIVAYRGWSTSNGRLMSVGIGTYSWPARRVLEAICARSGYGNVPPHNAPHLRCQCGVYGFATPESLDQVLTSAVLGRVSLGGEVVVCADEGTTVGTPTSGGGILGFRAQSAYPSLLFLWGHSASRTDKAGRHGLRHPGAASDDVVKALAEAYGVETAPLPDELVSYVAAKREAADREHDKILAASKAQASTRTFYDAQAATLAALYSEQQAQQAHRQSQMSNMGVVNAQGYTHQDATVAKALGLEIATPDTIKLHDQLTALARRAGLVK